MEAQFDEVESVEEFVLISNGLLDTRIEKINHMRNHQDISVKGLSYLHGITLELEKLKKWLERLVKRYLNEKDIMKNVNYFLKQLNRIDEDIVAVMKKEDKMVKPSITNDTTVNVKVVQKSRNPWLSVSILAATTAVVIALLLQTPKLVLWLMN